MKEFTIVRGLFDTRKRSLMINEDFIRFENKDLKNDLFSVIDKKDIAGICYGIHFIDGYRFTSAGNTGFLSAMFSAENLKYSLNFFTEESSGKSISFM